MNLGALATLLGHHWRRHRLPLVPMALGLASFEFLITRIAPAPDDVSWMSQIFALVPPQLLALAGNDIGGISAAGFLAIGYGHPFVFLLLSAWAVRVSSGALAGEIGRGTMDLIASRPIARWHQTIAGALAIGIGLALLVLAAAAGTALGLSVRPLGVAGLQVARMAVAIWLLFVTWGLIGLLVSALQREGGSAMGWTSGIIAASFVLEYIARLWQPMSAWRPFSLFAYTDPQHIVRESMSWHDASRLAAVAVVALVGAIVMFRRRDL